VVLRGEAVGRRFRHAAAIAFAVAIAFAGTHAGAPSARAAGGATFVPFGPARFVDSRIGLGVEGRLAPFAPATFAVAGANGVPAEAVAVTGNLTVVGQSSAGYLALTTAPIAHPGTSTLNFPLRDIRANGVHAGLAPDGTLSITASTATNVVFDVTGYFVDGSGATFYPLEPSRLIDTRIGLGLDSALRPGVPRVAQVTGLGGVPADAVAVTGNVVAVYPGAAGFVAITTDPDEAPDTSTLNFRAGEIKANNFAVALGDGGTIGLTFVTGLATAATDVVLDITGYYAAGDGGARFFPIDPVRVGDSRVNLGVNGPLGSGQPATLRVAGQLGIPGDAQAVAANVVAVPGSSSGYGAITPLAEAAPATSSVNFPRFDTRANGVLAVLSPYGTLGLTFKGNGAAHFVVDVTGYFAGGSAISTPTVAPFTGMSIFRASAWSSQASYTWCVGAAIQMQRNLVIGASAHDGYSQALYVAYSYLHSQYVARAGAEVDGWAATLTHLGVGFYKVGAYDTFDSAVKAAATRLRITSKPVGVVTMEGRHAWVMVGFESQGDDPAFSQSFTVTSVTVMAPLAGRLAYDPAPGVAQGVAYLTTKLTPYADDFPTIWDGKYVIIEP
jgi:hypothetical protein